MKILRILRVLLGFLWDEFQFALTGKHALSADEAKRALAAYEVGVRKIYGLPHRNTTSPPKANG
jgi:hypothetical protein